MNASPQSPAHLSVIVPARNEEAVIGACLESLACQGGIAEILVVNDQSTDGTARIVRDLIPRIPHVRLLETGELPAGWVGKNHAVWLGTCEARGEWLLFTDADAVHGSDSAARALKIAAEENAVLVSFSPEQAMVTWYEKALIPYVYCRLANRFSYREVNDPTAPAAAANGQFLLIRREVYDAVGGHASVAGEVLEDVALAKRVKSAGYRIWFGSGKGIVRVRMYRSFRAMWEGWRKNLSPLMGGNKSAVAREWARAMLPVLVTLVVAISAWGLAAPATVALGVLAAGIVGLLVSYAGALRRNHFSPRLAWYGILGRILFAGVLWASYRSHRRGKLEWKGREYPVGTPGASN